jgi:hypothetical protein
MAVARKKPMEDPLPALAAEIENCHQAAYRAAEDALNLALRCGDLLIEAKAKIKHGEWLFWPETNTTVGNRQAQNYIRLAKNRPEIEAANTQRDSHLPVREAIALLAEPKPKAPVLGHILEDDPEGLSAAENDDELDQIEDEPASKPHRRKADSAENERDRFLLFVSSLGVQADIDAPRLSDAALDLLTMGQRAQAVEEMEKAITRLQKLVDRLRALR